MGCGYYNGDIKTRKTIQAVEFNADQLGLLQRSEQLRELYESLAAGESTLRLEGLQRIIPRGPDRYRVVLLGLYVIRIQHWPRVISLPILAIPLNLILLCHFLYAQVGPEIPPGIGFCEFLVFIEIM